MSGAITINDIELYYRSHPFMGKKYIVTYLTDYDESVNYRLIDIARIIWDCKQNRIISWNTLSECNTVAERVTVRLKFDQYAGSIIVGHHVSKGKIVLGGDSIPYNEEDVKEIYGSQSCITGSAFHALSYVSFVLIGYGQVYIGIDGSSATRVDEYFANMIVAPSLEELEQIIRARYQYEEFVVCGTYEHPDKALRNKNKK